MENPETHQDPRSHLVIGENDRGNPVSIKTARHAITIAGSQSGKGVGVSVPN